MIELHRREEDYLADEINDRLKSMVVAFRTFVHTENSDNDQRGSLSEESALLPHIKESGKLISGKKEISKWLEELDLELQQQRSVSGDGCYIDPKSGKVC